MRHCAIARRRLAHRVLQSSMLSVRLPVDWQHLVRGHEVGIGRHLVRASLRGVVHDARVDVRDVVVLGGRAAQQVLRGGRLQDARGRHAPPRVAKVAREVPQVVALAWHLHVAICEKVGGFWSWGRPRCAGAASRGAARAGGTSSERAGVRAGRHSQTPRYAAAKEAQSSGCSSSMYCALLKRCHDLWNTSRTCMHVRLQSVGVGAWSWGEGAVRSAPRSPAGARVPRGARS